MFAFNALKTQCVARIISLNAKNALTLSDQLETRQFVLLLLSRQTD